MAINDEGPKPREQKTPMTTTMPIAMETEVTMQMAIQTEMGKKRGAVGMPMALQHA